VSGGPGGEGDIDLHRVSRALNAQSAGYAIQALTWTPKSTKWMKATPTPPDIPQTTRTAVL
jgi:hypothetical protein